MQIRDTINISSYRETIIASHINDIKRITRHLHVVNVSPSQIQKNTSYIFSSELRDYRSSINHGKVESMGEKGGERNFTYRESVHYRSGGSGGSQARLGTGSEFRGEEESVGNGSPPRFRSELRKVGEKICRVCRCEEEASGIYRRVRVRTCNVYTRL